MTGIDNAVNLIRTWDRGRQKLWGTPAHSIMQIPDIPLVGSWQYEGRQQSRLHGAAGRQASYRYWHHHTPRPDAIGGVLALLPIADDGIHLHAPDLPKLPYKDYHACLQKGITLATKELAAYPLTGCCFVVLELDDNGNSSADGVTEFASLAAAELIYSAYRSSDFKYL